MDVLIVTCTGFWTSVFLEGQLSILWQPFAHQGQLVNQVHPQGGVDDVGWAAAIQSSADANGPLNGFTNLKHHTASFPVVGHDYLLKNADRSKTTITTP
jgi:hypothetical protein